MAAKKLKKLEEFNLMEHLTRGIGEMFESMGINYYDELKVESPKVAKDYGIPGIIAIHATKHSNLCHGLMPYYVFAYDKNYEGKDCMHWTPKYLINVYNYVVYAYNKWVDKQSAYR